MAPVTFSYRNDFFLCLNKIACLFQVAHPRLAALVAIHSLIFSGQAVHGGVLVYAAGSLESGSDSDLKIVRVMSRSYLYGSRTFFRIRIRVSYDRYFLSHQRKDHLLSHHVLISVIVRMNCYGLIGKHSLRPRSGYHDSLPSICGRVPEIPVLSVPVLVFHFCVGQRCFALRAPIYEPVSSVYKSFLI